MIGIWSLIACFSAGAGPEPAGEALVADSFRQCRIDSDCVVAPALSGLDHLPKVGESCGSECVVGIAVASQSVWAQAVRDLAPKVPCELEFEQCPPLEHWKAYCASGICTTKYQVPMPSQ